MVGRMTKRILAIGAALLLCLLCVCAWAEGENCRLTLTLAFGEQPVEGAEFSLYRVGEMQMSGGAAGFVPLAAYAKVCASFDGMTASQNRQYAEQLAAMVDLNAPNARARTGKDGGASYENLTAGMYLAVQTGASGQAQAFETCKPFLVSLPTADPESGESKTYLIPYGSRIKITDGQILEAGDELTEGSVNPHDILRIKGVRAVQDYMIREVQRVYRLQGVEINDKHIEVIVRQMLKKIRIEDNGDTEFLPGTLVDFLEYEDVNEQMEKEGKQPADGKQVMLGITKASLATNSFLSAASFQETTKVLTEAAIKGKVDPLIGLKENVIIGKLIPAGTGMKRYRDVRLNSTMPEPEVKVEDIAEELTEDEEIKDDEMVTMDEELPEDEEFDVEESDEEEAAEDEADDQASDDAEDNE